MRARSAIILITLLNLSLLGGGCGRLGFDSLSDAGSDLDADVDGSTAATNRVFVTSTAYLPVDLGSLEGGDEQCRQEAEEFGIPGTFVAWLSGAERPAAERLGDARGWVRVDGRPVVDTVADLVAGRLLHPILLDSMGARVGESQAIMTGTATTGMTSGQNCSNFATSAGSWSGGVAVNTTGRWTQINVATCTTRGRIYCFGVEHQTAVAMAPVDGRLAFITEARWIPGGGLAAADALCQQEAGALGFKALLATSTASAASRFDSEGAVWMRPDGVPLADSAADFLAGQIHTSINVTANGNYVGGNDFSWTGATSISALGSASTTCGGSWSATTSSGSYGLAVSAGANYFSFSQGSCTGISSRLYCLQE